MRAARPHAGSFAGSTADGRTFAQQPSRFARNDTAWHTRALRSWLLALLRLAVTGDRADRMEVMANARALDGLGTACPDTSAAKFPAFRFFHVASMELCHAMADPMHLRRSDILRRHIARIEDPRLKRAFAAAVEIAPPATSRPNH